MSSNHPDRVVHRHGRRLAGQHRLHAPRAQPGHPRVPDSGQPVYYQKKKEDEFWNHERYDRAPILGPITSGAAIVALDPPSDDEVMRALEKASPVQGGVPLLYERNRNNVRIVKCKIADYVDPPRFYPLVGPAQQHHAHYKCTVYYEDVRRIGWPVPHTLRDEDAREVIYIDHNHLHMVGNVDTGRLQPVRRAAPASADVPPRVGQRSDCARAWLTTCCIAACTNTDRT